MAGWGVLDARRLKTLEGTDARLKKLLAVWMLDNVTSKDIAEKTNDAGCEAEGAGSHMLT